MKRIKALLGLALAAIWLAGCSDATSPSTVDGSEWRGEITIGGMIEIKGVIGSIGASATSGSEVVVSWTKDGHGDDPDEVRVDVVEHAGGVTICAVYPTPPGRSENECAPGTGGRMAVENNDVEVTFTVLVPQGVDFIGRTVSGSVEAAGLNGDAFGWTVTGDVRLFTDGIAEGTTVTGSVIASVGRADWGRDLDFTTVTGSVDVEIPAGTNAEVRATTVTGSITSDFGLTHVAQGTAEGTIGTGGQQLTLTTVTGSIILRRGA